MRDAQSAFDQVISFSEGEIGTEDVETALGLAGAEMLARVMRAVAAQTPAEALAVVDDLVMRGHDLRNFCRDLLAHLRDLLVVKVAGDREALADASEAERRELSKEAGSFSESDLVRFFHSLTETEKHLRESAHPRYQLEIGLVKLIEMRRLAPLGQIIERLSALEEALRTGKAPAGGAGASSPPGTSFSGGGMPHGGSGGGSSAGSTSAFAAGTTAPSATGSAVAAKPAEEKTPRALVESDARAFTPSGAHSLAAHVGASPATSSARRASVPPPPGAPSLKLVPPASQGADTHAPSPAHGQSAEPHGLFDNQEPPSSFRGGHAPGEDWAGRRLPSSASSAPFDTNGAAYAPGNDAAATPESHAPASPPASASDASGAQPVDSISLIKKALDERRKPFLSTALGAARRAVVEGDELVVEFAAEGKHLRETLSKPDNLRHIREACREVLGRETNVRVNVRTPGESGDVSLAVEDPDRLEQKRLRELAANHPSVQEALKTFGAEIVEVQRVSGEREMP
ncbi:MAG: hypothetical protein LC754_04575 [Acidobacteria bacterium]|nr:hypothetical protein [Acidobacteriota bacterium]